MVVYVVFYMLLTVWGTNCLCYLYYCVCLYLYTVDGYDQIDTMQSATSLQNQITAGLQAVAYLKVPLIAIN